MTRLTTDEKEIQQWAEEHDNVPVQEGDQVDIFPEESVRSSQKRIDWETFHRELDRNERVVAIEEESSEPDRFEVSQRDSALERIDHEEHDREDVERRLVDGETITGTATETTVVTETVVEEATLESEVTDREVVDREVTDVELLERNCRSCSIDAGDAALDGTKEYDRDRFLLDDADVVTDEREQYDEHPYGVTVDVDERWAVTIEERERFEVETRITDVDVTETDTVDSRDYEADFDLDAVHTRLLRSIDVGHGEDSPDIVDTGTHDIESEFVEDDRISTTLTSRRVMEREISEQWELEAEVVAGMLRSREIDRESVVEGGLAQRTADGDTTTAGGTGETTSSVTPTEDDVGKPVVVSSGDQIAVVTRVENGIAYTDPRPGLTERIMSTLGWGGKDDEDLSLDSDRIAEITDDEIRLAGEYDGEELEEIGQTT